MLGGLHFSLDNGCFGVYLVCIYLQLYIYTLMESETVFKALADPTRQAILQLLKKKDLTPSDLLEQIQVSQPTLSHHLDILKRANLIEGVREGQYIRYSLNMTIFQLAVDYLLEYTRKR